MTPLPVDQAVKTLVARLYDFFVAVRNDDFRVKKGCFAPFNATERAMRNPFEKCWRYIWNRPSPARYIPTDLKFDERDPSRPPPPKHPMRRKTDRFPRQE